ncbi:MAG: TonB family protein [Brevundimonas sp.]|uniref:TonB family protein n=1 Tax=Brevundimonas sp. TaxID=1871086 RepID=UPI00391A9E38
MMMKLAGGPGSVNPLDFNSRKRPVPRWVWLAVGASLLVHGAAGVWLYQQRFELRATEAAPEPPITILEMFPRVIPPEPQVAEAPPPPTAVHNPVPTPFQPTETAPFTPPDVPVSGVAFDPIFVPATPGPVQPAAPAQTTPEAPPGVIANPRWIARPTPDQMARAYPDRAARDGVEGSATLQCSVTARGGLTACSVLSETPGGYGFGRAAMQLSRHFRLSPRTVDGQAVEGAVVTIPLTFQLN